MPDNLNYHPTELEVKLLKEKRYTCECCGFKSRPHRDHLSGYMELVNIDGRITCLCALCASSQKLGRTVEGSDQHGLIIYLPQLTQGQLTNLVRICHVSAVCNLPSRDATKKILGELNQHTVTEDIYPFFTSHGGLQSMVEALRFQTPKTKQHSNELFGGLRYLPNRMEYWTIYEFWHLANPSHFEVPHALHAS